MPVMLAGGFAARQPWLGLAAAALTALAAWPFLFCKGRRRERAARLGALLLAFGLGWQLTGAALEEPPALPDAVLNAEVLELSATIEEVTRLAPRQNVEAQDQGGQGNPEVSLPFTYRLLLDSVRLSPPSGAKIDLPGKLVWTWDTSGLTRPEGQEFSPPLAGQTVVANLRVREQRGLHNPGLSDLAERRQLEGIRFRAYSRGDKAGAEFSGEAAWGQQARAALQDRFVAALVDPCQPGKAILPALVFGDRAYLGQAQTDLFAKAALSHSLALSGMHLGFMVALGWALARLLCRLWPGLLLRLPRAKWAVLCATPLALAYLWLGGASPSLLRAALMFACWGVLVLFERPHPLVDGLFAAVFLLYVFDPLIIFDLRLQLSALAVLAIALTLPGITWLSWRWLPAPAGGPARRRLQNPPGRLGPWQRRFRGLLRGALVLVCISAAVQVIMAPLQARVFNQATPWFALNLLWLPVLSFWVFPWSMAGLAFCAAGLALPASWALELASWPGGALVRLLAWMDGARLLFAPLVARPHVLAGLGYAALLAALFLALRGLDLGRVRPGAPRPAWGAALALFLAGFAGLGYGVADRYVLEHPPGPRLRVLDVGHGLALLLEGTAGRRILVDGGGSSFSAYNVGDYVLIPLLTDNRPPRLEAVLNTHPDADHLRGLLPVLRRLEVGEFWLTRPPGKAAEQALLDEALRARGVAPQRPRPGEMIPLDAGHYLRVLYPPPEKRGGANTLSLAARLVRAKDNHGLALLTGDLTKSGLRAVMRAAASSAELSLRSDVVQVPHHGSRHSLVAGFYALVKPEAAAVSTAYGNSWGFPSPEVRETLQGLNIPLFDTALRGQIVFSWDAAGDLRVECAWPEAD